MSIGRIIEVVFAGGVSNSYLLLWLRYFVFPVKFTAAIWLVIWVVLRILKHITAKWNLLMGEVGDEWARSSWRIFMLKGLVTFIIYFEEMGVGIFLLFQHVTWRKLIENFRLHVLLLNAPLKILMIKLVNATYLVAFGFCGSAKNFYLCTELCVCVLVLCTFVGTQIYTCACLCIM